jgi:putative protein kinase ArgK-like GTPase of G3E family
MNLIEEILQANPRAIARAMSLIENQDPQARDLLKALFPKTGRALVIGVTGAPGSGKSTLVDKLTEQFRSQGKTVGIVAVDPTSPFSGGAILADRVRMSTHYNDEGVFIRSMATRGHLGGLSKTAAQIVTVLDAAGKDMILLETVGVGQDEVEVVKVARLAIFLFLIRPTMRMWTEPRRNFRQPFRWQCVPMVGRRSLSELSPLRETVFRVSLITSTGLNSIGNRRGRASNGAKPVWNEN